MNCHAGKEPPETAAAETAKASMPWHHCVVLHLAGEQGAADDADLDLDDLEGDDDEDDLEACEALTNCVEPSRCVVEGRRRKRRRQRLSLPTAVMT